MVNDNNSMSNNWGLRCAWALAAIELGLSGFSGISALSSLPLQLLMVIGAFGIYGVGGIFFDAFLTRLKLQNKLLALVPLLLLIYLAQKSALMSAGNLNGAPRIALAIFGIVGAIYFLRRQSSTKLIKAAPLISALTIVTVASYLLIPRCVTNQDPIADADASGPNVVLITWDTIRADVLPLYGGTGLETPVLDDLASRSTVFDKMSAVAPITGPSHASILTGVVPPSHALRSNGTSQLSTELETAAEIFSDAGYATGGFISAYPVRGDIGFDRGFDVFDDRLPNDRVNSLMSIGMQSFTWLRQLKHARRFIEEPSLSGDVLLERTDDFLTESQGPFFMWTHFFDAHGKHRPAPEYRKKAMGLSDGAWPPAVQPEAVGDLMTLYRGEIMELDSMLEDLLTQLEQKDPGLKNTVIFLLSDHGQCFGENGYVISHTPSLTQATQHIPGVLYIPGNTGSRSPFPTNQIDVLPTLLSAAGLPINNKIQGVDLTPIAQGDATSVDRKMFANGFYMEAFQLYLMGGAVQDLIRERKSGISTRNTTTAGQSWVSRDDQRKQALLGERFKYVKVLNDEEFLYDLTTVDDNGQADAEDIRVLNPDEFQRQSVLFYKMLELIPHAKEVVLIGSEYDNSMLEQLGYTGGKAE
ncbi:MAG: sulfatase [Planctomycetes bacterium]|nr:sulfatase [Planctomycetota bacterium]